MDVAARLAVRVGTVLFGFFWGLAGSVTGGRSTTHVTAEIVSLAGMFGPTWEGSPTPNIGGL